MASPSVTTNRLYNEGGTLKFNGSEIGGGGSSAAGWTDDGSVVRLTTLTDSVGVGTTSPDFRFELNTDQLLKQSLELHK